jgi:hypothetical protein
MNAVTQARVRHILIREYIRRGRLTWDMKIALRRLIADANARIVGQK